jgi:hypothetical protein
MCFLAKLDDSNSLDSLWVNFIDNGGTAAGWPSLVDNGRIMMLCGTWEMSVVHEKRVGGGRKLWVFGDGLRKDGVRGRSKSIPLAVGSKM